MGDPELVTLRLPGRGAPGERAAAAPATSPTSAPASATTSEVATTPAPPTATTTTTAIAASTTAVISTTTSPAAYVETYGCQMNVADSDLMVGELRRAGYRTVDSADAADLVLLNTCAVRERAEETVLRRLRHLAALKRRRPSLVLGVTGCMAEHLKERLGALAPEVDLVAGPDSYRRLADLVGRLRGVERRRGAPLLDVRLDRDETYAGLDPAGGGNGVGGFVTIQRGCDKFCTFCVVPFTRGRERGTPPREVLRQARALAAAGHREVTLLGQTVNSYRHEEVGFADLLRAVARVDGLERVRFTSPYPVDFTADVVRAIAEEPRVCKHVHLPLQSASDRVLARMRRGYGYGDFVRVVDALRAAAPGLAITTDVLVGFSGETEEDHRATLDALAHLRFDAAFLFAYSERDLTQAARRLPDDVPDAVKRRRLAEAIALQERCSAERNAAYVGRTERVLLHAVARRSDAQLVGRTDTFKAVVIPRGGHAPGELVDVRIERSTSATLFGTPVPA